MKTETTAATTAEVAVQNVLVSEHAARATGAKTGMQAEIAATNTAEVAGQRTGEAGMGRA
jgi:hypothetical protein